LNLLSEYAEAIEKALETYMPERDIPQKKLLEAMRYSLLGGGKRLRPMILLEFCRSCGGEWEDALPFACALEMIHVYSLIHDDLPCMDNDSERRGKPANHIAFGEATALLAGSALLSMAFEVMLAPSTRGSAPLSGERALRAARIIVRASGLDGIAGGQEIDLCRGKKFYKATIYRLKTSAMFIAAAQAGCVIAGADEELLEAAYIFGEAFGMGLQYADDYADGNRDETILRAAQANYQDALDSLRQFNDTSFLEEMIRGRIADAGGG
jgi:geranylgeranyl diphosphate synthase type II